MLFGAAMPCFMVSKIQISSWPVLRNPRPRRGTLFVDRASRASAEATTVAIAERLKGPSPVLFFPEGTSTDGTSLLRFHSRFYTPAMDNAIPITAAAVHYTPRDGSPESNVCWYGDEAFLPHLWRTLGGPDFSAEIRFGEPRIYVSRRAAADATYAEIHSMREQPSLVMQ